MSFMASPNCVALGFLTLCLLAVQIKCAEPDLKNPEEKSDNGFDLNQIRRQNVLPQLVSQPQLIAQPQSTVANPNQASISPNQQPSIIPTNQPAPRKISNFPAQLTPPQNNFNNGAQKVVKEINLDRPDNAGRTRQQVTNRQPQNPNAGRPNFQVNPNQVPNVVGNPNRPFQPNNQIQPVNVGPAPIRPEVITVPLTNPRGGPQQEVVRISPVPNRPPQQPRPQTRQPPPQPPSSVEDPNAQQIQIQQIGQQPGFPPNANPFQPLIVQPGNSNVSRPRVVIPPQSGNLAPIQTPNGRLLLEPYPENFCDMRQFPDEQLAARSLQRVEYFVANLSCSRYFFECAIGQTFMLNCTGKDQVYDIATVNCNFRRNVRTCPEYDHILHCTIKEQCMADQFACCATPQTCIPYSKRCDGTPDCQDGDDENNCPACEPDEFPCVKSGRCIKLSQRCNGYPDECYDQTNLDEFNCQGCGPNKFYCIRSETCVDVNLRCNGIRDCPRGEDELNCKMKGPKYLLCENQKQSVAKEQWCDGYEDCVDGSDEKYCIY